MLEFVRQTETERIVIKRNHPEGAEIIVKTNTLRISAEGLQIIEYALYRKPVTVENGYRIMTDLDEVLYPGCPHPDCQEMRNR